jgi:hypothetical protein
MGKLDPNPSAFLTGGKERLMALEQTWIAHACTDAPESQQPSVESLVQEQLRVALLEGNANKFRSRIQKEQADLLLAAYQLLVHIPSSRDVAMPSFTAIISPALRGLFEQVSITLANVSEATVRNGPEVAAFFIRHVRKLRALYGNTQAELMAGIKKLAVHWSKPILEPPAAAANNPSSSSSSSSSSSASDPDLPRVLRAHHRRGQVPLEASLHMSSVMLSSDPSSSLEEYGLSYANTGVAWMTMQLTLLTAEGASPGEDDLRRMEEMATRMATTVRQAVMLPDVRKTLATRTQEALALLARALTAAGSGSDSSAASTSASAAAASPKSRVRWLPYYRSLGQVHEDMCEFKQALAAIDSLLSVAQAHPEASGKVLTFSTPSLLFEHYLGLKCELLLRMGELVPAQQALRDGRKSFHLDPTSSVVSWHGLFAWHSFLHEAVWPAVARHTPSNVPRVVPHQRLVHFLTHDLLSVLFPLLKSLSRGIGAYSLAGLFAFEQQTVDALLTSFRDTCADESIVQLMRQCTELRQAVAFAETIAGFAADQVPALATHLVRLHRGCMAEEGEEEEQCSAVGFAFAPSKLSVLASRPGLLFLLLEHLLTPRVLFGQHDGEGGWAYVSTGGNTHKAHAFASFAAPFSIHACGSRAFDCLAFVCLVASVCALGDGLVRRATRCARRVGRSCARRCPSLCQRQRLEYGARFPSSLGSSCVPLAASDGARPRTSHLLVLHPRL